MAEFVLNHEAAIRLEAFSTLLVGLAVGDAHAMPPSESLKATALGE
jgi:hypothetical protein